MSGYEKLSHGFWRCRYHIVWTPKYRYRILKRRKAIRVFKQFPYLKKKPSWVNHFQAKGYCVDTIGLNQEMIKKYVKYQETKEREEDQRHFQFLALSKGHRQNRVL